MAALGPPVSPLTESREALRETLREASLTSCAVSSRGADVRRQLPTALTSWERSQPLLLLGEEDAGAHRMEPSPPAGVVVEELRSASASPASCVSPLCRVSPSCLEEAEEMPESEETCL